MGLDRGEVVVEMLSFIESGQMLREMNQTVITWILKMPNLQVVGDFKPVSVCNVLYKLVAKMLVNRMCSVVRDLVPFSRMLFRSL